MPGSPAPIGGISLTDLYSPEPRASLGDGESGDDHMEETHDAARVPDLLAPCPAQAEHSGPDLAGARNHRPGRARGVLRRGDPSARRPRPGSGLARPARP